MERGCGSDQIVQGGRREVPPEALVACESTTLERDLVGGWYWAACREGYGEPGKKCTCVQAATRADRQTASISTVRRVAVYRSAKGTTGKHSSVEDLELSASRRSIFMVL